MKKTASLLTIAILAIITAAAQLVPRSDVLVLTDTTALQWDPNPEPDIAGYLVQIQNGSTIWSKSILGTNVTSMRVFEVANVSIPNGVYTGRVAAYNLAGLQSDYTIVSTNLVRKPGNSKGVKFRP